MRRNYRSDYSLCIMSASQYTSKSEWIQATLISIHPSTGKASVYLVYMRACMRVFKQVQGDWIIRHQNLQAVFSLHLMLSGQVVLDLRVQ